MEKDINTKGWIIFNEGDPSVGIPSESWKIEGDMVFPDQESLEDFRVKIQKAFESLSEVPLAVLTLEEQEEEEKMNDYYEAISTVHQSMMDEYYDQSKDYPEED